MRASARYQASQPGVKKKENEGGEIPALVTIHRFAFAALESDASSAEELYREDDEREHEQEVDQATNRR